MAADPQQSTRAAHSAATQDEMQEQLQALARKLLDLWQDHVSALAQDPTLMAQALKLLSAYTPFPWPQPGMAPTGGTGFAPFPNQFAGGQFPGGQIPGGQFPGGPFAAGFPGFPFGGSPTAAAPGAAPAAAASDAGDGAVGELRRRLAELESRLAELEQGAAKPARKRAAGPRTRAPKGG